MHSKIILSAALVGLAIAAPFPANGTTNGTISGTANGTAACNTVEKRAHSLLTREFSGRNENGVLIKTVVVRADPTDCEVPDTEDSGDDDQEVADNDVGETADGQDGDEDVDETADGIEDDDTNDDAGDDDLEKRTDTYGQEAAPAGYGKEVEEETPAGYGKEPTEEGTGDETDSEDEDIETPGSYAPATHYRREVEKRTCFVFKGKFTCKHVTPEFGKKNKGHGNGKEQDQNKGNDSQQGEGYDDEQDTGYGEQEGQPTGNDGTEDQDYNKVKRTCFIVNGKLSCKLPFIGEVGLPFGGGKSTGGQEQGQNKGGQEQEQNQGYGDEQEGAEGGDETEESDHY